jgi:hypothetical protein
MFSFRGLWWLFEKIKNFFLLIFLNFPLLCPIKGAVESGEQYLGKRGWHKGKHG